MVIVIPEVGENGVADNLAGTFPSAHMMIYTSDRKEDPS